MTSKDYQRKEDHNGREREDVKIWSKKQIDMEDELKGILVVSEPRTRRLRKRKNEKRIPDDINIADSPRMHAPPSPWDSPSNASILSMKIASAYR
ncbi:hypothetical protein CDAR_368401 [Caerostris darwini]|uniref:Uncharacterized protein n=1 Tax=Caerostris darwini TaxID=1538125 RepID=A0AAV4WDD6_9ARAC|nr:hypothetical protein CDAR_368401 [Caerostris darwini]